MDEDLHDDPTDYADFETIEDDDPWSDMLREESNKLYKDQK